MGPPAMSVPSGVVPNSVIAERLGVAPDWIEKRTGVRERHLAGPDERLSSLAAAAGGEALVEAGIAADTLDMVLVATMTADEITPNAAPLVAAELGATQAVALDVGAACSGFLAGLGLAVGAIESGRAERVLLIGADLLSRVTDKHDRPTAGLFGDGAGAIVLSAGEGERNVGPVVMHVDPAGPALTYARRDVGTIHMEGPETFRIAVDRISEVVLEALDASDASLDDVDLFVFHQANGRILKAVGDRLGLDPNRVVNCVDRFANTSAASVPIALASADAEGLLRAGDLVVFGTIGAGFVYGACVMRWEVSE